MITAERLQPNASNEQLLQTPADALANRIQHFNSPNFALAMVNAAGSALYEDTDRTYTAIRAEAQELGLSSLRDHDDYETFRQKRDALRDMQQLASDIEQTGSVRDAVRAQRNRQMERRIAESRPFEVNQVDATAVQPKIELKRTIESLRERKPLQNIYAGMRSVAGQVAEKARDAKDTVIEKFTEKKRQIGRVALVGALLVGAAGTVLPSESHNASPVAEAGTLRTAPNLTSEVTRPTPGTVPAEKARTVETTPTTAAPVATTAVEAAPPAVNLSTLVAEVQAENAKRAAEAEAQRIAEEARIAAEAAAAEAARAARLAPYEAWLSDGRLDPRISNIYRQLILKGHDLNISSTKRNNGGASRHDTGHAIDSVDINGVPLSYYEFNEKVQHFLDDAAQLMPENCEIGVPNQEYVNRTKRMAPEGCYVFVDIGTGPHIHLAVDR